MKKFYKSTLNKLKQLLKKSKIKQIANNVVEKKPVKVIIVLYLYLKLKYNYLKNEKENLFDLINVWLFCEFCKGGNGA